MESEDPAGRDPMDADEPLLDGRYRLGELLGSGGMGRVVRAHDVSLGRDVAVKLFHTHSAEGDQSQRIDSEIRLLASLNHPALVTLLDARISDAQSYLVMELVDGPTLRERLGELAPTEVATMALDLAEALHVVHAAGVVHRDIKPSNVLLAPSVDPARRYRAKLADFGIAYLLDSVRVTTPGMLVGTAGYVSPEQARGAEPAPAADVYALGLVLLETLTGRQAYPHAMPDALMARLDHDPEIPAELGYGWKSLLSAMTARAPEARPVALEVVAAARTLLTDGDASTADATRPVDARPPVVASVIPPAQAAATELPRTRVLPTESTRLLAPESAPAMQRPGGARRWVLIASAAVVALGLAGMAYSLTTAGGSPPPAPSTTAVVDAPATTDPAVTPTTPVAPPVVVDGNGDKGNGNEGPGKGNEGNGNGKKGKD